MKSRKEKRNKVWLWPHRWYSGIPPSSAGGSYVVLSIDLRWNFLLVLSFGSKGNNVCGQENSNLYCPQYHVPSLTKIQSKLKLEKDSCGCKERVITVELFLFLNYIEAL